MANVDKVIKDLVINEMSQEEFDAQKAAGTIAPNEIYVTPDKTDDKLDKKADRDFNNTDIYDYVIAEQKPNASNNYTWYKKYKSGWVEQGGRYVNQSSSTGRQITLTATLPIPVTDFSIIASPEYVSGDSIVVVTSWSTGTAVNTIVEKNTVSYTSSTTSSAHWVVFGNAQ